MITVPFELYSSKNSKRILFNKATGRSFVAKSKQSEQNEKDLISFLVLVRGQFAAMLKDKEKPYRLHFKIYRKTKRRFDYVNIVQGILDSLVKSGLLEDDNADILIPVFEPYEVDKYNPRTLIWIE